MVAQESTAQKDEEIIISIVKEMTESMTGAQSTRHWAGCPMVRHPTIRLKGHSAGTKLF